MADDPELERLRPAMRATTPPAVDVGDWAEQARHRASQRRLHRRQTAASLIVVALAVAGAGWQGRHSGGSVADAGASSGASATVSPAAVPSSSPMLPGSSPMTGAGSVAAGSADGSAGVQASGISCAADSNGEGTLRSSGGRLAASAIVHVELCGAGGRGVALSARLMQRIISDMGQARSDTAIRSGRLLIARDADGRQMAMVWSGELIAWPGSVATLPTADREALAAAG